MHAMFVSIQIKRCVVFTVGCCRKVVGSRETARLTAELFRTVISLQRVTSAALVEVVRDVGQKLIAANPVGMCVWNLIWNRMLKKILSFQWRRCLAQLWLHIIFLIEFVGYYNLLRLHKFITGLEYICRVMYSFQLCFCGVYL